MVVHSDDPISQDLIRIYDGNLNPDFCQLCINLFERDDRKIPGVMGQGCNPNIKDSMDLLITDKTGWEAIDTLFHDALSGPAQEYFDLLSEYKHEIRNPRDTGYQIQKTVPDGGYIWHNDSYVYPDRYERIFTYIWYLNDVEEEGFTEFLTTKIKPRVGRLVLFPSTWTYLHRGIAPKSGNKYICTGWMLSSPISN
jgi:hypothetical protein